jgi:hypothetical protein
MKPVRRRPHRGPQGSALVLVLIFIGMFPPPAVAMATISGANVQVARDYQKLDNARAAAEPGQEVPRYRLGGVVNGSIINYSNNTMSLSGNGDLLFNRSGLVEVPAGFEPQTVLDYDPASYTEVVP